MLHSQKQSPRGAPRKGCSENMQENYRRTPMPKCDFNKVEKQLFWNHTLAWVFSCKFAAYFQNIYFFWEHLWCAASVISLRDTFLCFTLFTLHYFYVALFSCCTLFMLHFFLCFNLFILHFLCCMLHFIAAFFSCWIFSMLHILHSFHFEFFLCCTLFMYPTIPSFTFSCCDVFVLHSSSAAYLVCCFFFLVHFVHVALLAKV